MDRDWDKVKRISGGVARLCWSGKGGECIGYLNSFWEGFGDMMLSYFACGTRAWHVLVCAHPYTCQLM